jgi:transposase
VSSLAGWKPLLGVGDKAVVQRVEVAGDASRVDAWVGPRKPTDPRCGRCGPPAAGSDHGDGQRAWRALCLGTVPGWAWAQAPRVDWATHRPTVI